MSWEGEETAASDIGMGKHRELRGKESTERQQYKDKKAKYYNNMSVWIRKNILQSLNTA